MEGRLTRGFEVRLESGRGRVILVVLCGRVFSRRIESKEIN